MNCLFWTELNRKLSSVCEGSKGVPRAWRPSRRLDLIRRRHYSLDDAVIRYYDAITFNYDAHKYTDNHPDNRPSRLKWNDRSRVLLNMLVNECRNGLSVDRDGLSMESFREIGLREMIHVKVSEKSIWSVGL